MRLGRLLLLPATPACLGYNKGPFRTSVSESSGWLCLASLSLEVLFFRKQRAVKETRIEQVAKGNL